MLSSESSERNFRVLRIGGVQENSPLYTPFLRLIVVISPAAPIVGSGIFGKMRRLC